MSRPQIREYRRRIAGGDKNLVGFLVGSVQYAVDIRRVREILRPLPVLAMPHVPPAVVGVADHRGEVVPVLELRRRFGLEPSIEDRRTKWILVDVAGRGVGLVVDAVTGVLATSDVDQRPAPVLGSGDAARGITAVYSHGAGLLFVLDIDRVAAPAQVVDLGAAPLRRTT
ncbi:MAG: chemotaxis protein CheW [Sandaracinaceae bacterium]